MLVIQRTTKTTIYINEIKSIRGACIELRIITYICKENKRNNNIPMITFKRINNLIKEKHYVVIVKLALLYLEIEDLFEIVQYIFFRYSEY